MNDGITLPVVELFGPTIQGEGMLIGVQSHFVRLAFCDFKCHWCDSMHAVDPKRAMANLTKMDIPTLIEKITALQYTRWVTISGGNPGIHVNVGLLVKALHNKGYKVAVETQGTLWQDWMADVDLLTWSPKPPSSGTGYNRDSAAKFMDRIVDTDSVRRRVCMKIPVGDETDFAWAQDFYGAYGNSPMVDSFVLQGVNDQPGNPQMPVMLEHLKWLAEKVLASGMSKALVLPQMHVLMWGNEVGK